MKKIVNISVKLVMLVMALSCLSCASGSGGHEKYRGFENSPFTNYQTHQVNPNAIMNQPTAQFNESMRKLNAMQDYKDRMNKTNAGSAAAESMWIAPVKSGGKSFIGDLLKTFNKTTNGIVNDIGNETRRSIRDKIRN